MVIKIINTVFIVTGYLKFIRPLRGLMQGKRAVALSLVVGSFLAIPSTAYADMGLPMIIIAWPGMAVMLIPVVALEVFVLMRIFGTSVRRTVEVATTSNIISTVVGIPVTWGILFGVQAITGGGRGGPSVETLAGKVLAVTWQAPWLLPHESAAYWMVPVAMLVLLVPFFFASWLIEYQISRLMMRNFEAGVVKNAVLRANLASYALLALVVIGALAVGICRHAGI
ncbi:MAG: hypothetical protein QME41_01190 [Actinomycetota bacterium]|nr:hypothetical protein [Actinomycetota bacterium]